MMLDGWSARLGHEPCAFLQRQQGKCRTKEWLLAYQHHIQLRCSCQSLLGDRNRSICSPWRVRGLPRRRHFQLRRCALCVICLQHEAHWWCHRHLCCGICRCKRRYGAVRCMKTAAVRDRFCVRERRAGTRTATPPGRCCVCLAELPELSMVALECWSAMLGLPNGRGCELWCRRGFHVPSNYRAKKAVISHFLRICPRWRLGPEETGSGALSAAGSALAKCAGRLFVILCCLGDPLPCRPRTYPPFYW